MFIVCVCVVKKKVFGSTYAHVWMHADTNVKIIISPFCSSLSILEDSAKTFLQSLSGKQLEQCTEDSGMIVNDGAKMTMEGRSIIGQIWYMRHMIILCVHRSVDRWKDGWKDGCIDIEL